MNSDNIEGGAKNMFGKAEEAVGDVVGDSNTQASGMARQVSGKAQEVYGDVKEQAQEAAEHVSALVEQKPFIALLVAGAVGFALGSLLTASAAPRRW
jgi:uncharacterized protein YjbJ (UPF0337 family)